MKLLVTGGAGYIGSHVSHQLVDAGHEVSIIDNFYSGHKWAIPKNATLIEGNIGDAVLLDRVFSAANFDAVLHFAAHMEVEESTREPLKYYRNNTVNSLTLLEACQRHGIDKFIFSSTAAVYGEAKPELLREADPLAPINPYGSSKVMTEKILRDLTLSSGNQMRYTILRYFNVAGARADLSIGQATPRATHLVKIAAETALGLRPSMSVFGTDYPTKDGSCDRDYIHVEDLANAHLCALEYLEQGGPSEVFNVGYGMPYSVRQVIATMKQVSGVDFKVNEGPRRAGDPASLAADSSKIRRLLGWAPKYNDLSYICKTALDWERAYRAR